MKKSQKKAAVIIATYNRALILKAGLAQIAKTKGLSYFDIFVIDNGSTDETDSVVKLYPFVKYIKNDSNRFVSMALNQVFFEKHISTNYKYVILLANDVLVDKNTFIELVDFLELNPKVGLTAPAYYEYDTNELRTVGLSINPWTSLLVNYTRQNKHINHFVSCYAFPSAVFQKLKGYNANLYPMIYEEPDIGNRVINAGLNLKPCIKAKIWHPIIVGKKIGFAKRESQLVSKRLYDNSNKTYLFFRNRIIYMSTYSSPLQFVIFYALFNPFISIYYMTRMEIKNLKHAIIGLIDGTKFALNKNEKFIKKRNSTDLRYN